MEQIFRITEEEITTVLSKMIDKKGLYLRTVDINELKKSFVLLFNRFNGTAAYNSNITILAEDQNVSNQFGELLAEMLERWWPYSCILVNENNFYNRNVWDDKYKHGKVIVVKNYKATSPEKLYKTLSEIEKEEWSPAVILCTTTQVVDGLKEYEQQDYRLFNYLCGHKVTIPAIEESYVSEILFERLERTGFSLTEEFKKNLDIYVRAVYPEARLTQNEFLEDLIYRIYQMHYQKIVDGSTLDETDVPYSVKAEELKTAIVENQNSQRDSNKDVDLAKTEKKLSMIIPKIKLEETHFDELESSNNVLILSMSTLSYSTDVTKYCIVEKGENVSYQIFNGVSQLEPGTKFFLSKLASQGMRADKIIVLATKETLQPNPKHGGKSAIDVYSENIMKYIKEGDEDIERFKDALSDKLADGEHKNSQFISHTETIKKLYEHQRKEKYKETGYQALDELNKYIDIQMIKQEDNPLQEIMYSLNCLAENKHVNLFMDLQGGHRSFMFTMFATITMLRDKNVTIKDMFAIKFERGNSIHPIEIVNSEYAIIDLVSGIRAFSRYGKVDELQRFLHSRALSSGKEKELLRIMENIDGDMQINNPEGFMHELDKLAENNALLLDPGVYNDRQFKLIVEDLKDVYLPLISKGRTILDQIQWFGEKAFTTSALTFIEDKIPAFMINNKVTPLINVSYDSSLSDEQICKNCGGQLYYRPENNIFNFGMKKIYQENENQFFMKVCRKLTRDCILLQKKYTIKCDMTSLNMMPSDISQMDSQLKNNLLKMEEKLGEKVWGPIKIRTLCGWIEVPISEFKAQQNIRSCGKEATLGDVNFKRYNVLNMFKDRNQRDRGRIQAVISYLKKEYEFDMSCPCERELLIECVSQALYALIFKVNNKAFCSIVSDIMIPVMGESSKIATINVKYEKENQTLSFSSGYDQKHFAYTLWEEIISRVDKNVSQVVSKTIDKYMISFEKLAIQDMELKKLYETLSAVENADNNMLLKYAELYTKCRKGIDDLKYERCVSQYDGECSYKKPELYINISDEYLKLYTQTFYYIEDTCLESIAGLRDREYGWIKLNIGNISEEKRSMLNTCLLFYQAFKSERNCTNHAEEIGRNHMDYRLTRKAIAVFVELCRRLAEMK